MQTFSNGDVGARTDLLLQVCHLRGLAVGSRLPLAGPITRVIAPTAGNSAVSANFVLVGLILPVL